MRGVWHHQDRRRRGPRELTGIVDLTRGKDHPTARLLDLVPGRSGTVYKNWLAERGQDFRAGVRIATLDPFQGYKNAIDDQLQDATSVLDAFHIVKLAGDALDEVRRRVQQDTTGHRGRKGDPLHPHSTRKSPINTADFATARLIFDTMGYMERSSCPTSSATIIPNATGSGVY